MVLIIIVGASLFCFLFLKMNLYRNWVILLFEIKKKKSEILKCFAKSLLNYPTTMVFFNENIFVEGKQLLQG